MKNPKGIKKHKGMKKSKGKKKSKRPKVLKRDDRVDFLSNMPDEILVLILSRLPSTDEVNRTSILSRRWRYLWTSIPSLDISCFQRRGEFNKNSFKEFVNWVLVNKSVDLDRFRLCCFDYYCMSTVWQWIHAAVTRNVKELDLSFTPKDIYEDIEMPHFLVTCCSLEVLRLSLLSCRLKFPSFPTLRVLELECVDLLDGDSVKCFLESCSLLEDLTLRFCFRDNSGLCISCPKLKKLNLLYEDYDGRVKISCPNLMFLELRGYVASEIFIERLDLLKEAVIESFDFHNSPVLRAGISQVESLDALVDALYERIDDALDLALPNLKALRLITPSDHYFREHQFIRILKYFPKLEFLRLTIVEDYHPGDILGSEDVKLAEAETEGIVNPRVKWLESFEYNEEKPKLDIRLSEDRWMCIHAEWLERMKGTVKPITYHKY